MWAALAPVLRAGGVAAFVLGTLWVLLSPPSFAGGSRPPPHPRRRGRARAAHGLGHRARGRPGRHERAGVRAPGPAQRGAGGLPGPRGRGERFDRLVAEAMTTCPRSSAGCSRRRPWWSAAAGARRAPTATTSATRWPAHHEDRIVLYQDTLERDFGHDPDLLRSRWSAPCATRSPTTWAGTSAVSAAWDCRPTLPTRPEGYPSGSGEVSEWLKERDWKSRGRGQPASRVRIPPLRWGLSRSCSWLPEAKEQRKRSDRR